MECKEKQSRRKNFRNIDIFGPSRSSKLVLSRLESRSILSELTEILSQPVGGEGAMGWVSCVWKDTVLRLVRQHSHIILTAW